MTKLLRSLLWSFVLMLAMILCWTGFYWALKALWWGINIFNWFDLSWINFLTEWIPGVGSGFLGGYAAMAILETRIRDIYAAALRTFPYIFVGFPAGVLLLSLIEIRPESDLAIVIGFFTLPIGLEFRSWGENQRLRA